VTDAREGRVSVAQWSLETLCFEYASPIQAPQFFIGRESQKDVWVTSLDQRKKILVTNMVKEEFKDIELHDGGGLNLMVIRDTQSSRKIDFLGSGEYFFLTFGFKDVQCHCGLASIEDLRGGRVIT